MTQNPWYCHGTQVLDNSSLLTDYTQIYSITQCYCNIVATECHDGGVTTLSIAQLKPVNTFFASAGAIIN
jgi:hypothetical protein